MHSAGVAPDGSSRLTLSPNPGTRANLNYLDQLAKFHRQHGTNLNRFPSVDKRPLDLYKLKKAVEIRGGFDAVCKLKKWAEIGRDLGYSGKIMSSLSTSLKNSYQRWLQPYEEYLRLARPGVQQQLELEHGGPFTPSPRPSQPAQKLSSKNPNATSNSQNGSPVAQTPASKPTPMEIDGPGSKQATPADPAPPSGSASGSGFVAVNTASGGFTAVNQSPSFVAVNSGPTVKREAENGSPTPASVSDHPPSGFTANGHGLHPMKRAVSHESLADYSQTDNGEDDGGSGRRSKRLKKGMPQEGL